MRRITFHSSALRGLRFHKNASNAHAMQIMSVNPSANIWIKPGFSPAPGVHPSLKYSATYRKSVPIAKRYINIHETPYTIATRVHVRKILFTILTVGKQSRIAN